MTVFGLKKEVAYSKVRRVNIEFDGMTLASIQDIPDNNVICDYVKEVFEQSKYCHPSEITGKFANDDSIMKTRRIKSVEMKPFQRLLHIFVMKSIVPQFRKRGITSFMDLTYMEYLLTKKLVNLPRAIIRHMDYVINVPHHELPYGELLTRIFEAFKVPLDDKEGEEPMKIDFYDETFLSMCQLRRENDIWWLGSGANKRRDEIEDEDENEEESESEDEENENVGESTPAGFEWEEAAEVEGEPKESEVEVEGSGSGDKFYDVKEGKIATTEDTPTPAAKPGLKKKGKTTDSGVNPSSHISDYDLLHLQAEFARALQANSRFQDLLQQNKPKPPTSPKS
ncbi:hypothetical protein Dimus_033642 [Dionaea muscipula]